jgi:hypothetical protein
MCGGEERSVEVFSGQGDHLGGADVDGRIILKFILEKWVGTCIGSIWLRIGTGGGLLLMR